MLRSALVALKRIERAIETRADRALPSPGRMSIAVVDDPRGTLRLIGVRGLVDCDNLPSLATTFDAIEDGGSVHVDVTDADIAGPLALERVERLIDRLELRGVRIRIVGLDPRHPAISQQRN